MEFVKGQLWWILQVIGSAGVCMTLAYSRIHGFCLKSYLVYVVMAITVMGWMFLKSYEIAPSFFQAWFIGTSALAIFGLSTSYFYFNEIINIPNYIGMVLVMIGSLLMII